MPSQAGVAVDRPVILLAASGLAREAAEAAYAAGVDVAGCLDDGADMLGREVLPGLRVLGDIAAVRDYPNAAPVVCAGQGETRRRITDRLAVLGVPATAYGRVVHPSVHLPLSCSIGLGCILLPGVVLTASVTVGMHVVCMPAVVLTHDDVIEDYVTLGAGATLGGSVHVQRTAYLGQNCSLRPGVVVGQGAMVGMGAVVTRSVPDGVTVTGVPARPFT